MKKHSNTTFRRIALPILLLASAATGHAGPRTSTNYTVATDTTDGGGEHTTSLAYTNDGSLGGITGISTVASPAQTAKHGYLGQITEVTALQLAATPTTVDETATRQLSAAQVRDDGSLVELAATDVTWSVASGPLSGIDTSGLATAATVYQNTAASAQGDYAGASGTLGLTVLNTLPDNFGLYAGDELDDAWQSQYFGPDNPLAGPLLDADQDGFSNKFEYDAGIIPTDPMSVFRWRVEPVADQPGQARIVFSPRLPDRTYTVKTSTDLLSSNWIPLSGAAVTDNATERTVTDLDASGQRKFYRVDIAKP